MGVIYKLTPEIREFILAKKQEKPELSCRSITRIVSDKYKIKLSKSSANSLFKQAGLSMPVGRRPKRKLKLASPAGPAVLVRGIKAILSSGGEFYLDGRLHTVWRSAQIPEAFSSPADNIKGYIENVFKKGQPWVLFFASGYESPKEELFEFISSLTIPEKKISQLILYDSKLGELEKINIGDYKKRHFIFGVWPWQFKDYIKVKIATEFAPFHFAPKKRDFYLAEAEVELSPAKKDRATAVKLRGIALKTALERNICLTLLSNFSPQELNLKAPASLYLAQWPDPEGALRDFSAKIEQFRKSPSKAP